MFASFPANSNLIRLLENHETVSIFGVTRTRYRFLFSRCIIRKIGASVVAEIRMIQVVEIISGQ